MHTQLITLLVTVTVQDKCRCTPSLQKLTASSFSTSKPTLTISCTWLSPSTCFCFLLMSFTNSSYARLVLALSTSIALKAQYPPLRVWYSLDKSSKLTAKSDFPALFCLLRADASPASIRRFALTRHDHVEGFYGVTNLHLQRDNHLEKWINGVVLQQKNFPLQHNYYTRIGGPVRLSNEPARVFKNNYY